MLKIISILTISDSMLDAPTFFIQNSSDLQDIQIHETCSCLRNCWFTWTPRPLMGGRGLDKRRRRKVKILIVINEPVMRWGKGVLPTREFQRERQFDIYKFLSQQKLRLFAKCLLNMPLHNLQSLQKTPKFWFFSRNFQNHRGAAASLLVNSKISIFYRELP